MKFEIPIRRAGAEQDRQEAVMCVPGCMDVVHTRLTRRGFFRRASLAAAGALTAGATLVVGLPKVKDATGAPVRLFALM
jgi:kynurenine formamidase